MLALLVASVRLLVLVPSDALREQVAAKFETLGVLAELVVVEQPGAADGGRARPARLHREGAASFAEACDVIIAVPVPDRAGIASGSGDVAPRMLATLFVDEAHHVAARSSSDIRDAFTGKDVVQFTATPFREDGRHLQGRVIYSFPLREAQAQRYFSQIDYTSVIDPLNDHRTGIHKASLANWRGEHGGGL